MTNSSTTTVSTDLSIYLKKSELPKNVSAFKNDAEYISSSTLNNWLSEHTYLTQDKIKELIDTANLVVLESVSNSSNAQAIARLDKCISGIEGEIQEIKERISTDEENYIPASEKNNFATKSDISNINVNVTKDINTLKSSLSALESKSDEYLTEHQSLEGYATEKWVNEQGFITSVPSLDGYATESWVEKQNYLTSHQDLSGYIKKSELADLIKGESKDSELSINIPVNVSDLNNDSGFITSTWVENKKYITADSLSEYAKKSDIPTVPSLSGYAKTSDVNSKISAVESKIPSLDGYATQDWVTSKKYLTTHQSLSGYAKTSDVNKKISQVESKIPSLDGYATQDWVTSKKYVEQDTLSSKLGYYALKSSVVTINNSLGTFLTKTDASNTYETKKDVESNYLSIDDAKAKYLAIEDYRGIKDGTTISSVYKTKTLSDLQKDINTLLNGFYIVDYNDIVIVKDHQIINMFNDGVPQAVFKWEVSND